MSPLLRSGLTTGQERICSHSPAKGSLWVRRQPGPVFSAPAFGTWSGALLPDRGQSPRREASPLYSVNSRSNRYSSNEVRAPSNGGIHANRNANWYYLIAKRKLQQDGCTSNQISQW